MIKVNRRNRFTVIYAKGKVSVNLLRLSIFGCLAVDPKAGIVLDLHRHCLVGSSALHLFYALLDCHRAIQQVGGSIVLVDGLGRKRHLIVGVKLAIIFKICRDTDEAIRWLMLKSSENGPPSANYLGKPRAA